MPDLPSLAAILAEARNAMRTAETAHIVDAEPAIYYVDGELLSSEAFEPRFDELRQIGYSWLNFNLAGLHEERLIVSIEQPSYNPGCAKTSVNFSGPAFAVVENGGKVELKSLG